MEDLDMGDARSRSLLKEPALHFAVLGLGLFLLWGLCGDEEDAEVETVVIVKEQVDMLRVDFVDREGRDPEPDELAELVDREIEEELLYREGLAAGLNRGDPIVRRRVVQKMRSLMEELSPVGEPDEAALDAWIAEHGERYAGSDALAITHIWFDPTRRKDAEEDARACQLAVDRGDETLPSGDPFVHGSELALRSLDRYSRELGPSFAASVSELAVGEWGLAESQFGWHVVKIDERSTAEELSTDFARRQAAWDWKQDRREQAVRQGLAEIQDRYAVEVEGQ